MKKTTITMLLGIMLGTMLTAPAVNAAYGVLAERSAQAVYIDGQRVELEAYSIDGNNYVKLRDIGAAVDFNVYWDGAVQIQRGMPYTGEAPTGAIIQPEPVLETPSETDYSAAATPEIFTGIYTREAYNAVYEVLAATRAGDFTKTAKVSFADNNDRQNFENLLINLANGTTISMRACGIGIYEIYAIKVDRAAADTAVVDLLNEARQLNSDRERVILLNEWICEHMTYKSGVFVGPNQVAEALEPIGGNCVAYATMMNFLCGRLGIPCIEVFGENHSWNIIWVDGAWGHTDVSCNDLASDHAAILFSDTPPKQNSNPEGNRFLMEVLIPGSTK